MRLEELERELLQERPEIEPDFATRLDEWAARGFPRGGDRFDLRRERRRRGPLGLFPARRRDPGGAKTGRRRRRWAPGDALAATVSTGLLLFLVVGVVALTQVETGGDDDALLDSGGGDAAQSLQEQRPRAEGLTSRDQGGEAAADAEAPAVAQDGYRTSRQGFQADNSSAGPNRRRVAQTVSVELATPAADFRESADGVLGVVADHNGFVMGSSVSGGDPNVSGADLGRARFDLRIPAAQLQPALAALSDLGHVVSRTDGTRDITARFNSARDRIETFTEARDRLLRQLEEAVTETEQQSIRRRLRIVENQLENAREDLARAQQRVRMVPVAVTIRADESIVEEGGAWGIGDAWDAARDVLRVGAGVGLIAAAVLLPLALIALIAFLAWKLAARIGRERALDEL